MCSIDSGGSWYRRLLERRLRPFLPSFMVGLPVGSLRWDAWLVLGAKDTVRGMIRGDSLAVFLVCGLLSWYGVSLV